LDPKEKKLIIWRNKMQARVEGRVELKDSIYLKMSPNWFRGILNPGPHLV
jgi:hypothetical protein